MKIEDYNDYAEYLPGITDECPQEFFRLAQIFSENVFELISDKDRKAIPYMMDDAIESFLVFENPVMTGIYDKAKRELITGNLEIKKDDYILVVKQHSDNDDNFFTIRFTGLHMTNHFYSYHNIGHFWISRYEYLRQLDYRLWVIRDKYQFFGKAACNDEEISLIDFYEFAPLRYYTCIDWEKEAGNECTSAGVNAFIHIAEEVNDKSFLRILRLYKKKPNIILEKILTYMFRTYRHEKIVSKLQDMINHASSSYPERSFGHEIDSFIAKCREKIKNLLPADNKICETLEEQPFTIYDGDFEYYFHFMFWKRSCLTKNCIIKTIKLSGNDVQTLFGQFNRQFTEIEKIIWENGGHI